MSYKPEDTKELKSHRSSTLLGLAIYTQNTKNLLQQKNATGYLEVQLHPTCIGYQHIYNPSLIIQCGRIHPRSNNPLVGAPAIRPGQILHQAT